MNRQQFIIIAGRLSLAIILAGIVAALGKKVVFEKNCDSCPDYASCPGAEKCSIAAAAEKK